MDTFREKHNKLLSSTTTDVDFSTMFLIDEDWSDALTKARKTAELMSLHHSWALMRIPIMVMSFEILPKRPSMKFVKPYYPLIILSLASFSLMGLSKVVKEDEEDRSSPAPHVMRAPDWNEQQATDWEKANKEIIVNIQSFQNGEIKSAQACHLNWNIAWTLAKKGNLEARYTIFNAFREAPALIFGSDSVDIISMSSIRTYLYYHSLGAPRLTSEIANMLERIKSKPSAINNYPEQQATAHYPEIRSCVYNHPSRACTEMIGYGMPTFESFAKQLDMLIAGGVGMPCINPNK